MTRTPAFLLAALVLPVAAHAQSAFSGKWVGATPSGSTVELTFTIAEAAATGTLSVNGEAVTVSDVKITEKDKRLTFVGTRRGEPRSMLCELAVEEMRCWPETQGPASAAVLKRAAATTAAKAGLAGKWEGVTPSGRTFTLDLEVDGVTLKGKLAFPNQTNALEGKVDGSSFSFTAGTIDGRPVVAKGKLVGEEIELNVEGVSETLKLKRAGPGSQGGQVARGPGSSKRGCRPRSLDG